MTLQEVFDSLVRKSRLLPSRIPGIKSSLKQYAHCLGHSDLASCPEKSFNLPVRQRNQIIEERAKRLTRTRRKKDGLSTRSVINIKDKVSFVLKEALDLGLIPPRSVKGGARADAGSNIYKGARVVKEGIFVATSTTQHTSFAVAD